jgi:hypothetical protein
MKGCERKLINPTENVRAMNATVCIASLCAPRLSHVRAASSGAGSQKYWPTRPAHTLSVVAAAGHPR